MSAAAAPAATAAGHPKGLYFLAFTEAWERFSYYGMSSLLVLYMTFQLLGPGHIENVAAMDGFRGLLDGLYGRHLEGQELASAIYGLYAGFVYFTPVLGGLIADRLIGQRNAVVIGALAMAGGHLAMAFDQSFLLALLLLIVGSGLLKGNISAQVGALYPRDDEARRTRGFAIFSMSINFGAVAGPVMCGLLQDKFGFHIGFGLAAIFMLAGLVTYLAGYRHLPARVERRQEEAARLTARDWRVILALFGVMFITIFQSIAYYQVSNTFSIWVEQHVALDLGGFSVPIPWFQSIDPVFSILGIPLLFGLWRWQARRRRGVEPGDLGKIAAGAGVCMLANLALVAASLLGEGKVSLFWPVLYGALQGIAFLFYWPTLLALVSRAAPASVNATMMGIVFLTLFLGNNIIGVIGTFYESLGPTAFWLLHAGIAAMGGLLAIIFARPLARVLGSEPVQPLRPSAQTVEPEV